MSGETSLEEVLKSMSVSCDDKRYGFASAKNGNRISLPEIWSIIREEEGTTIIAGEEYFKRNGIDYDGPFAKLTIDVHTSLDLKGLTATLAKKLVENDISANVVAGYFHDHIFVQFDLREKAISAISELKSDS